MSSKPKINKGKNTSTKKENSQKLFIKPSEKAVKHELPKFLLAIFLIIGAFILPELLNNISQSIVVRSVQQFELENELAAGTYKLTLSPYDTQSSDRATFYAVSIIGEQTDYYQHLEQTKSYTQPLEDNLFKNNLETSFQSILMLKNLKMLETSGPSATQLINNYYRNILSFSAVHSGFKLSATTEQPSVSATSFAFKAIEQLGKMEEFKSTNEFKHAITFVASMQNTSSQGFRDSQNDDDSMSATLLALQILSFAPVETMHELVSSVSQFIFACQCYDGGFSQTTVINPKKCSSNFISTAQALHILSLANYAAGLFDISYFNANSYLRACLSLQGVLPHYSASTVDLESSYYFIELARNSNVNFGTPRIVAGSLLAAGLLFIALGFWGLFKNQYSSIENQIKNVKQVLLFNIIGIVLLNFIPAASFFAFTLQAMFIVKIIFDIQKTDPSQTIHHLAGSIFATFFTVIWLLSSATPELFVHPAIFLFILIWAPVSSFIGSYGYVLFMGSTTLDKNLQSSYCASILNLVIFFNYLYFRGNLNVLYPLLSIKGLTTLTFVGVPFTILIVSLIATVFGASLRKTAYFTTNPFADLMATATAATKKK
eukprot:TRINITY_DN1123_c0_g1_i1.p1 TRINITY_DN1123_c0_g1~~TRINITY_DN1123_c0_g1_i1.p1  ORF type:complete len:603 (-),score=278.28 TRINITY_DN1123_c0_g1_i1:142-1950(-)